MEVFAVGDQVETIDDTIKGSIVAITGSTITIESEEGFLLHFTPAELMKIDGVPKIRVTNYEAALIKKEKEPTRKRPAKPVKSKERNAPRMEVDLHINQLTSSTKGMSNFDILNLQLETAKRQLLFAMDKRIQKVVFIHGVGEGVLKEELYYLFKRYENVSYYDADYQKYGLGATEIYIYQSS